MPRLAPDEAELQASLRLVRRGRDVYEGPVLLDRWLVALGRMGRFGQDAKECIRTLPAGSTLCPYTRDVVVHAQEWRGALVRDQQLLQPPDMRRLVRLLASLLQQ